MAPDDPRVCGGARNAPHNRLKDDRADRLSSKADLDPGAHRKCSRTFLSFAVRLGRHGEILVAALEPDCAGPAARSGVGYQRKLIAPREARGRRAKRSVDHLAAAAFEFDPDVGVVIFRALEDAVA